MRTYTFKRECGHTTRGTNKAKALARPCNDCIICILENVSLPKGFYLWSESLQVRWVNEQLEKKGSEVRYVHEEIRL